MIVRVNKSSKVIHIKKLDLLYPKACDLSILSEISFNKVRRLMREQITTAIVFDEVWIVVKSKSNKQIADFHRNISRYSL